MRGATLTFFDDGQSRFGPGAAHAYTYAGGGTARGSFAVRDDNTVCIVFENGFDRCDMYVRNGGRLIVITEQGDRFPVRP